MSHKITRVDAQGFRMQMMNQCGRCHEDYSETFFDTYHGKVSQLGSEGAAKCYDCHGTHNILPPENPESTLSHWNLVDTCAKCHPKAHRQFAGYLTHATHHDTDKYPFLFYSFWFMTILLVGTLSLCDPPHSGLAVPVVAHQGPMDRAQERSWRPVLSPLHRAPSASCTW